MNIVHDDKEIAKIQKKISFCYHYDIIPQNEKKIRSNRVQCFIVFQNDDKSSFAGTTVFIKESHKYMDLFNSYMQGMDPKFIPYGCPAFMKSLKLDIFNGRLAELRAYLDLVSEETEDESSRESNESQEYEPFVLGWAERVKSKWVRDAPKRFDLIVSDYRDGDIVLFHCGVIHAVLMEKENSVVRSKVYLDIYGKECRKPDDTGFLCSDGIFKKRARSYEKEKMQTKLNLEFPEEAHKFFFKLPHNITINTDKNYKLKPYNSKEITNKLNNDGVVILRGIFPDNNLLNGICKYLQTLMDLPKKVDLSNPTHSKIINDKNIQKKLGVNNNHLRRNEKNGRETHFPKNHGISGYGVFCKDVLQSCAVIHPLIKDIYKELKFGNPICSGVDLSYQTG